MTIYLDVVLIENLCMNYIILFATGYIMKLKRKHIRLIVSSLLGAVYSIIVYMEILQLYSNIIMKIILSIVMIYIAYVPKSIKDMFKGLVLFYFVSFVFGGCAFALLYFVKPQEILIRNGTLIGTYPIKIAILGGFVGFMIMVVAFYIVKAKISRKDFFCNITIFFESKKTSMKALIDTGNMLKEPITNIPVVVVEKDMLEGIISTSILKNLDNIIGGNVSKNIYEDADSKYISKFRVIPYKSLGKENGLLLGFKVSKVIIERGNNKIQVNNVIVGIYDNKLSKKNQYSALIGFNLVEGGNENELVENVSR